MEFEQLKIDWERWKREEPAYGEAGEHLDLQIIDIARKAAIKCETSFRTKSAAGFIQKAIKKRNEGYLIDPWGKITDKVGVRAILEIESDIDKLFSKIQETSHLNVVQINDTRFGDPQMEKYRGLHAQVVSADFPDMECELQIRTRAQDLWASVVSHRFLYKPLVETSNEVKRSLYRLVSLVELFDQEVDRAMSIIKTDPQHQIFDLLSVAETEYLSIVLKPDFDRQLSLEILSVLVKTISETERFAYPKRLATFVKSKSPELKAIIADYGNSSPVSDPRYILFSQPEILIFLERLENADIALEREWIQSGLPAQLLQVTSAAWGSPI